MFLDKGISFSIKSIVIGLVMLVWTAYMLTYLIRLMLPEPFLWGVPTGMWLALNPPIVYNNKKKSPEVPE